MNEKFKLRPSLFWDTRIDHIDTEKHARFVIERVIARGTLDDWKTVLNIYGHDRVRREVLSIRSLDPKSLAYLSIFFDIDETEFKCLI